MTTEPDTLPAAKQVVYSADDENFGFETLCEVFDALDNEGRLEVGTVYYEIDSEPVSLARYLSASDILEAAEERSYDDLGDASDGAFDCSAEAVAELDAALKAWAEKHLTGGYWRCVGKSRELTVTDEDCRHED